jgi:hypothetical protein
MPRRNPESTIIRMSLLRTADKLAGALEKILSEQAHSAQR